MAGNIVNSDVFVSEQAAWSKAKHDAEVLNVRLFSNNFTPTPASVAADFTEATFAGYALVVLTGGNWAAPVQATPGAYGSLSDICVYTSSDLGGQQIYGWYAQRSTDSVVLHSGLLPAPVFMADPQELRLRINYQDWAIILL